MSTQNKILGAKHTLLALALAAGVGPALAQGASDVEKMIRPDTSSVGVGLSAVSGKKEDRANFGQYNGFRKNSGQLDLDVDYLKREESTGTWTAFTGRNLGNENRELGFSQQKQGDWKYSFEYGELVRNYTNTINTGLQGIGTANLTVTSLGNTAAGTAAALAAAQGTGTNVDLKTTRKALSIGAEKWLTSNLLFEASFKSENKDGARMFGKYAACSATLITAKDGYGCTAGGAQVGNGATATSGMSALLMLPEPISSTTRQFEAKLNYSDDKLLLSGAYYGSFYTNNFGSLSTTYSGSLWNPNGGSFNPAVVGGNGLAGANSGGGLLALPPDNQSHQLSLTGTYAISPTTRATFKYAYTHGTQKESFDGMGLTGGPRGSLDGVIDTTTAQFGLTARPMPKLSLVANLRYEQKSDKTPIESYVKDATTGTTYTGKTNMQSSHTKIAGKFEASYQLPDNYRATGGVDIDMRDLGVPVSTNDNSGQAAAIRSKTQERTFRGELRKAFAENFSGAVGASHSFRSGSSWMAPSMGGAVNANAVTTVLLKAPGTVPDGVFQASSAFGLFPLFSMDLQRDKMKVSGDWSVTDDWSLQAAADVAAEHYFAPSQRGAKDAKSTNLSLDTAYKLSDKYKMTAWYSRSDNGLNVNSGTGGANTWMGTIRQLGHNLGVGFRGAPTGKLEVGADLTFSYEVNRTSLGVFSTTTQPTSVPAAAFRQLNLNIFSKYALDKTADIRVNFAHQRYYSNEWYWNNNGTSFFYSDGSTLTQKDQQNVTFIGAAYIYKFQ